MAASDEHADRDGTGDDAGVDVDVDVDAERYEQLRRRALAGDAAGWRSGMAVLQRHGLVAWLRAWRTLGPPCPPPTPPGQPGPPAAATDQLVQALASMALGALASG